MGAEAQQLLYDCCRAGQDRHTGSKLFLNTLKGHTDAVNGLSFNADGLALVTACDDRTVRYCLLLLLLPAAPT